MLKQKVRSHNTVVVYSFCDRTEHILPEIEKNVRAKIAEHLKQLLHEDHRYIFMMIQKFRTEKGGTYPELSDKSDIIALKSLLLLYCRFEYQ
ncbi:MAG: hypothetical protein V7L04_32715 [Nostoc sp.]|uniref:hypothetical protein n=1 Tax=Nostoc sp. TaxID=1180 RepID=UPI002FFB1B76